MKGVETKYFFSQPFALIGAKLKIIRRKERNR
jgi:hypothetical protein